MAETVEIEDVLAAQRRIAPFIAQTPLVPSKALSMQTGQPVFLKLDHHQPTGSFKLRGAANAVARLATTGGAKRVGAASTGNHGRALAHAAREIGMEAVICLSSLVPDNKVRAIGSLGAEVRRIGKSQDDAQAEIDRLCAQTGLVDIPPFDHRDVIAGQGTLGLEVVAQQPHLDAVLVPLSGGGLISGVALAVKARSPGTRVIGVCMERGAAMVAALRAGKPVVVDELETLADSLGGGIGMSNRHSFAMVRRLVDDVIMLTEREIAEAIAYAFETEGEVLEGAGAVGIGAVLAGKFRPQGPTVLVLSGGNIDPETHAAIVARTHPAFASAQ